MRAAYPAFNGDEVSTAVSVQPPKEATMIASRTTRFPNVVTLSALLVLAVLATAALLRFTPVVSQPATRADAAIANAFPNNRLNEFRAYRLSEWGVDLSPVPAQAPWFDLSRLPAGYVRSEKGGTASHTEVLDLYTQLITVK
jgi:hypothetical protein